MGFDLKKDMNLKAGFVAAEMLPESLRSKLEEKFGMMIRQTYGTADVRCLGYECIKKNGMHIPDDKIVEIVDPETGKQLGPGKIGEIVATTFNKIYPLIRFGTGDLSILTETPCPCGRTSPRLLKILGRVDQATKVRGLFVHPGKLLYSSQCILFVKGARNNLSRNQIRIICNCNKFLVRAIRRPA